MIHEFLTLLQSQFVLNLTPVFMLGMALIFTVDAVLMIGLDWLATRGHLLRHRIQPVQVNRISPAKRQWVTLFNNALSFVLISGYLLLFHGSLLRPEWPGLATWFGEALLVLLVYDCAYYFYHRTLHHPKLMRYVHGMHHFVRFPTAGLSNYLNPLEQFGALSLLFASVWLIGPISEWSFLLLFTVHSIANIIVHCNVVIPHPAFRLFNFWVVRHDIHHRQVKHNYASIFPFWDQAFGTFR